MTIRLSRTGWIILALVAAAALAAVFYYQTAAKNNKPQYRTVKLESGPITAAVSATGTINPVVSVQVGSQVSGQIKEILVDFNSEVKQGQLIARIDPETFEYRVRQSQADLDAARASQLVAMSNVNAARASLAQVEVNSAEARRSADRTQQLVAKNFISPSEGEKATAAANAFVEQVKTVKAQVEVALAQVKNAESIVKQREAQLAQARIDLERTSIKAPVDGIVIKRSVDAGQTVAASLQAPELFIIAKDLRDMEVQTSIDEADVANLRVGQPATFTVDAIPGRTFQGTIKQVRKAATVTQNVVTYTAVISTSNPDLQLLPGMTTNVRIITASKDKVLKVANAALRYRPPGETAPVSSAAAGGAQGAVIPAGAGNAAGAGGGQGGGGQMRQLRERLVTELKLDKDQQTKFDAVLSEIGPKMRGLRDLPEEERRKAGERIRAEMRERIAAFLTPEQRKAYEAVQAEQATQRAQGGGRGRIYTVTEDGKAKAVDVRLGLSDGSSTEVIAEGLTEGAAVVVGMTGGTAGSTAPRPQQPTGPRFF